jgi:GNAT superfamily N-acetyltransferase
VSELFLAPDARGRGHGSRLLAAAVAEARARGCSRLGLLNNRRRDCYTRGFYTFRG